MQGPDENPTVGSRENSGGGNFMDMDISQTDHMPSVEEELQLQMRFLSLLSPVSRCLDISARTVSPDVRKEAEVFSLRSASVRKELAHFASALEENRLPARQAKDRLLELMLKNQLTDWIRDRILRGCKTFEYDAHGQGVIHLCAMLGHAWAAELFAYAGLSGQVWPDASRLGSTLREGGNGGGAHISWGRP